MWNDAPSNFVPNDMGGAVLSISSDDLTEPLVVDGLESITVAFDEDDFTLSKAASGMTTYNRMRTLSGTITFEVFSASPSIDTLSTLVNAKNPIKITYTDPARPNLKVSCGYAFIQKSHDVQGTKETPNNSYVVLCAVLRSTDGGFSVVEEA